MNIEDKILELPDDAVVNVFFENDTAMIMPPVADLKALVRECRELREAAEEAETCCDDEHCERSKRLHRAIWGHSRQVDPPPAPPGQVTSEAILVKLACFDDEGANEHLLKTGSYGRFDEPVSVKAAREELRRRAVGLDASTRKGETS